MSAAEGPLLDAASRPCPVCATPPDAGRLLHDERLDAAALDRFAFASRKVPEQMHWRLLECPVCGVAFASPAPSAGGLAAAYREAGYDSSEEARYAAVTYGELVSRMRRDLPPGAVLDVGAGDGAFLDALRALGFREIAGVEPSREAMAAAAPATRELIREGVFRAGDFEAGRFALVSCLDAIEHLPEPLGALRDAHALLREGGAVLVVAHDRHGSLNRLLGRRSPIFDIEHVQLFDPRSLRALLERAGFASIEIRSFSNRTPQVLGAPDPLRRRIKLAVIAALDRVGLGTLPLRLPVGNLVATGWKTAS